METIKPSPCTWVTKLPSQKHSRLHRKGDTPLSMTTSFSTTCSSRWALLSAEPEGTLACVIRKHAATLHPTSSAHAASAGEIQLQPWREKNKRKEEKRCGCAACLSWHVGTLVCSKTSLCSAYFHCIEANFLLCEAHKQTSELTRQREMMADRKTSSQGLQVSSIYNTMI